MINFIEGLPETVWIDNKEYDLNMSYDNILAIQRILNDRRISEIHSIVLCTNMLIKELPQMEIDDLVLIFEKVYSEIINPPEQEEFLTDLQGNPLPHQPKQDKPGGVEYDIELDSDYIYSSFMLDYGIDLIEQKGKLHWYKFKALLDGLSDNTKFKKVLEIRAMKIPTGKGATPEQKKQITELKRVYKLKKRPEQ